MLGRAAQALGETEAELGLEAGVVLPAADGAVADAELAGDGGGGGAGDEQVDGMALARGEGAGRGGRRRWWSGWVVE